MPHRFPLMRQDLSSARRYMVVGSGTAQDWAVHSSFDLEDIGCQTDHIPRAAAIVLVVEIDSAVAIDSVDMVRHRNVELVAALEDMRVEDLVVH